MRTFKHIWLLAVIVAVPFTGVLAQSAKKKAAAKKSVPAKKKYTSGVVKGAGTNGAAAAPATTNFLKDTASPREVVITSAFKPSLRNAAKVNFTAATPLLDTAHLPLNYTIPSQSLFFSFQPVPIKPLALFVDSSYTWMNNQYIKAGFGNYTTPYVEVGIGLGDGRKNIINLHGKYTSSQGNLPFQQFNKTGITALGIFNTNHNQEVAARLFFDNSTQYKYGFQSSTVNFTKDDLRQQFNNVGLQLGFRNKQANSYGITYHPEIQMNYFTDNRNANEFTMKAKGEINKSVGRMLAFDISATADITQYSPKLMTNAGAIKNNLFYITPALQFKTPNFKLNVGVQPSWDNQTFSVLPDITAEAKIADEKFIIEAGWIGYFNKNTYQSLTAFNPYIGEPAGLYNTKIREQYAGFKGSAGKHFTYNARLSFLHIENLALFANDTALNNTQTFHVLYDPTVSAVRLHGEIGYTVQEKFIVNAAATYTQYTKLAVYDKAYGLLPFEVTGSLRWKVLKDLQVKSDVFFWDGTSYPDKTLQSFKLPAVFDANAGVEFAVAPRLNLWLQFNNLFNNHYQRWNQYQVLGFQVIGGVVYSFR